MHLGAQGWKAVPWAVSPAEIHGAGNGIRINKPEAQAEGLEDQFRVLMYYIKFTLCFPPVVVVGLSY